LKGETLRTGVKSRNHNQFSCLPLSLAVQYLRTWWICKLCFEWSLQALRRQVSWRHQLYISQFLVHHLLGEIITDLYLNYWFHPHILATVTCGQEERLKLSHHFPQKRATSI